MENTFMAVDIGTTSVKVVLFDEDGNIVGETANPYTMETDETGKAELNPDLIYEQTVTGIRETTSKNKRLKSISFSSQMHSLMVVNRDGDSVTNLMTWADTRPGEVLKDYSKEQQEDLYQRTGVPTHAMSWFAKLQWMKSTSPEVFDHNHKFIGIKEYIFYKIIGSYVVDESIANATGIWNRKTESYDQDMLEEIGIVEENLSKVVATTQTYLIEDKEILEELNLQEPTTLVIGASDGVLANIGLGASTSEKLALSIGTSGALRIITDKEPDETGPGLFSYVVDKHHWLVGGPINNGGMVIQWGLNQLLAKEQAKFSEEKLYAFMFEQIAKIPIGSEGLYFHPYLSGERAPLWNADAKGSFYGLTLNHSRFHMMRALLEGVNLNIALVKKDIEKNVGKFDYILATGGFTKSPAWIQMLADTLGVEIRMADTSESTSYGAVLLGKQALRLIEHFENYQPQIKNVYYPKSDNVLSYQQVFNDYKMVLNQMKNLY